MGYLHALRYLWQISSALPVSVKQKWKVMSRMGTCVRDYVTENTSVDEQTIVLKFGDPQQIAATYVNEMDTEEILQHLQYRTIIIKIVVVISVIILAVWLGVVSTASMRHFNSMNGYHVEEIVESE